MADVSLQSILDQTRRAIDTGDTERAIGMAQHILQSTPTLIEGHRLLGEAYLNADQPEQARTAFQNVLRADPENIPAYYGLGLANQRLGQPEAAIRAFEMALEIQPNLAELRTQLLRLYSETPGSAGQFRLSRSGLGRLYARGQMYGQAIDEFRAVLDNDPDRDDVRVALAETLWRDGQEDEAGDFSRATIERQPELHKPTLIAGYLQLAAGEPEGETLWHRAAAQEPSLQVATTLFDVMPPIALAAVLLPAFDMTTWRTAQVAVEAPAHIVEEATPDIPSSVVVDTDVFGSTAAVGPILAEEATAEPDIAGTDAIEDADLSDNDLLAQLLGFSEDPDAAPGAGPILVTSDDEPSADANSLPTDAAPQSETFSFDEWSFDDQAAEQPAASPEPHGEVQPFSLDETDTDEDSGTEPFSFGDLASEEPAPTTEQPTPAVEPAEATGGVQPFSLDDWETIPGLEGDADAEQVAPTTADTPADGEPQPFSLDDFLNEPVVLSEDEGTEPSTPVDEVALNTDSPSLHDLGLADEGAAIVAGAAIIAGVASVVDDDTSTDDDFTALSLRGFEGSEDELQDLDELGQLDTQPGASATPAGELPAWAREDAEEDQDTVTEVPDWLREQFDQAESAPPPAIVPQAVDEDLVGTPDLDVAPFSISDIDLDDSPIEEVDLDAPSTPSATPSTEPEPFSFADLGLDEADFDDLRLAEPGNAEAGTADEIVPFGLADLDPDTAVAPADSSQPYADPDTDSPQAAPPELADLGLSDNELAEYGDQPGAARAAQEPPSFAFADLGLSDAELAAFVAGGKRDTAGAIEDEDTIPDQDTLNDTSRIEGDEEPAEASASSIHAAETQPFEVASIMAEGVGKQPASIAADHDAEPALPSMPPDLARFYDRLEADPSNHTIRLALARLSGQKGDTDRALEQYRLLIKQGMLLDSVVEDLQEMTGDDYGRPMQRRLHRLLGDAYTKQNRLDEALDEYSWS